MSTYQKFDVTGLVSGGIGRRFHRISASSRDEAWSRFQAAYSRFECTFIEAVRV